MPSAIHAGGPPRMTVDELRAAVLAGEVDTVIVAFTDMQGRLQGKRLHGHFFLEHVLDHGTEGCNYLLAVDVDMNTVGGYAISSWERGYGDMFFEMDLTTLRRTPGGPGLRDDPERPHLARRLGRGRAVSALDPQAPGRVGRRGQVRRVRRNRARVHPLRGLLRVRLGPALPGPHRRQPLQRRLLHPRWQQGRAGAARDPQRDVHRGHDRRVGQGGVQPRPARDRLPLRRRAAHVRQPQRLQDRGEGDRRPARPVADLHGQVRRARGQLVPHPPVAARRRRRGRLRRRRPRRRTQRALRPVHGRAAGHDARADLLLCTEHQLLQAVRGRLLRADRRRLGHRQPHVQPAGRRPRAGAARREPRARRRRQPLPRGRRDARRRAARHPGRPGARRPSARGTPTSATTSTCPPPWPRPGTSSRAAPSPGRPSATPSSTTTSTPRTSSSRPSTPR